MAHHKADLPCSPVRRGEIGSGHSQVRAGYADQPLPGPNVSWADKRRAPDYENPQAKDPEGSADRDARPLRGADHADLIQ